MTRYFVPTLAVLLFIVMIILAQGIGESLGHGLREWMVR